jgi:TonB family protein
VGGLAGLGTGDGGGGTHEGTLGLGQLGTLGRFGGGRSGPGFGPGDGPGHGPGSRYGVGAGALGPHHAVVPDFRPGIPIVNGSLDKEIIRRIVRRHLNEVRFCYEQALAGHPGLAGRVVVQFSIAPTGRVLASFLQSSSLGVVAVDACVVNAVKRWEFPEPRGGGLVMVSYPFQLAPAGG